MKKFSINCQFGGQTSPFTVYIGKPEGKHHPLHFQADWLAKERGGNIPSEVMDSLSKLMDLSRENNVPFEDLCTYALEAAQQPSQAQVESQNNAVDQYNTQDSMEESLPKEPGQNSFSESEQLKGHQEHKNSQNTKPE